MRTFIKIINEVDYQVWFHWFSKKQRLQFMSFINSFIKRRPQSFSSLKTFLNMLFTLLIHTKWTRSFGFKRRFLVWLWRFYLRFCSDYDLCPLKTVLFVTLHLHTSSDFTSPLIWVEHSLNGLYSHYIHTVEFDEPGESHTDADRHLLGLNELLKGRTKHQCSGSLERDGAKTTAHPHDDLCKQVCVRCVSNQTGIQMHTAGGFSLRANEASLAHCCSSPARIHLCAEF